MEGEVVIFAIGAALAGTMAVDSWRLFARTGPLRRARAAGVYRVLWIAWYGWGPLQVTLIAIGMILLLVDGRSDSLDVVVPWGVLLMLGWAVLWWRTTAMETRKAESSRRSSWR